MVDCTAIIYMTYTSLVWIERKLNADSCISHNLRRVVVPRLRGLPNATFEQDYARPHAARRILTFLDIQDISLLPWSARILDLQPIENI